MAIIRCSEGFHLFDDSKHTNCPYCRNEGGMQGAVYPHTKPAAAAQGGANSPPPASSPAHTRPAGYGNPGAGVTQSAWSVVGGEAGKQTADPVVGWLVCIKGANLGRDYRIHAGVNAIGRDPSNEICITGDEKISRVKQASVVFDPENWIFYLQHGGGRNITYVNQKPALELTSLQAYDRIKLGTTTLLFVPLCGEHFQWEGVVEE